VYRPDGGQVLIDGRTPFDHPDVKSRVFFLPDTPYFIHQANLMEMAAFYHRMYPRFSYERFNYLTTIFPIQPKMRISTMSKGMQRQAALMLALSTQPDYLLLDEAFDGLDPVIRSVLKRLLAAGIAERNMTVVIASHNLRELEDLCDRAGLLHKGKLIFNDELDLLKGRLHKVQAAFRSMPEAAAFAGLEVLQTQRQGSLLQMVVRGEAEEISARIQTLEPLFLELLPPTLEEIFIYELEVAGYDVRNILG
ncbi:MAG: ABC transporter ATP-binding protein, partial [Clostridiales bacterium]|nr:ABC transporter ATP-binding protein [Clostridiales bacterium]